MSLALEAVSDYLHRAGYNTAQVAKFLCWYKANPQVWREFERITLDLIGRRKKAGSIDIMGRIRWECEIERGDDFKANNNYAPYLARVFALKYPQHKDYFDFREVGQKEAA